MQALGKRPAPCGVHQARDRLDAGEHANEPHLKAHHGARYPAMRRRYVYARRRPATMAPPQLTSNTMPIQVCAVLVHCSSRLLTATKTARPTVTRDSFT